MSTEQSHQARSESEPVRVVRFHDATGSHIEPPLEEWWGEARKLNWHAAVVAHDTGLDIRVHPHTDRQGRAEYSVTIGSVTEGGQQSLSARPYRDIWGALSYILTGARAVLAQQAFRAKKAASR